MKLTQSLLCLAISATAIYSAHAQIYQAPTNDTKTAKKNAGVAAPAPSETSAPNSNTNDNRNDRFRDCNKNPRPDNCPPPYLYERRHYRPVIIQSPPAAPPVDDTPTGNDWEGCKKTKLNQIRSLKNGDPQRANQLDEWLWKNCRNFSDDLRDLEQDGM